MNASPSIYVASHRGMGRSAIARPALTQGHRADRIITRIYAELDLTDQAAAERPDQIYLAAAKVGGIHVNNLYPAGFVYQNLMVQANLVAAAFRHGVQKLLFLGSSCLYPTLALQPMLEDALLTGTLEVANEPYAIAKIAGTRPCESYNRQNGESCRTECRVLPWKKV